MVAKPDVRVARVYNKAEEQDGVRILVDHIWPRGNKAKAALNEWCKDVSPSTGVAQVVQPRPRQVWGVRSTLPCRT